MSVRAEPRWCCTYESRICRNQQFKRACGDRDKFDVWNTRARVRSTRGYQSVPSRRWLQDTSKRKLADFFYCFRAPPPSCFPGFTRGWPDDWSKQARRIKKSGWLKLLAGFARNKASTRRVNRKIADSTRNQRVYFSRYLAANYALVLHLQRCDKKVETRRWVCDRTGSRTHDL